MDAQPGTLLELIVDRGLIGMETLSRAMAVQAESGERLDAVLTRLGLVSEAALTETIAAGAGLRIAGAETLANARPFAGVAPRFLREAHALPLGERDEGVEVAFADPLDPYPRQALAFALGRPVIALAARAGDIETALDRLFGMEAKPETPDEEIADEADLERLKDMASDAPVIRAVNGLIARAAEQRASDIHVEPTEDALTVRFRIDGALVEQDILPNAIKAAFVSRIKVLANLNIAERRLPQDGRMRLAVRGHEIDLRVATAPTIHGESVVMRLLDRSHLSLDFAALGFDDAILPRMHELLSRPHGVVLVTGPTGSGKTTTLYAALSSLNTADRKILTVEDPIEYRLGRIGQTQVSPQIGLTFAAALRSFLRQDPDVIMVGEIRDLETAQVAVQAALTGHTILSTLHTNSAATAVTRLIDMGVEPFLITSTLNGVLGQRLVRKLCQHCREPYDATAREARSVGLEPPLRLWRPTGCQTCGGSGFQGRLAILELLPMTDEIAGMVMSRAEARDIERAATAAGMRTILRDGVAKALAGLTTLDEVLRVTRES
ncbi:type II secretion system protein GspE [Caulobacter flavus]|uniref:Type II secretion system protein GspE n=1 Tax=Caulobacter flavus TaxID=1679497 RepID=A0A2N5CM02_9CAUL|nr:ATPase, T2SS/T4P/T4SS family [Caulobacter flavus]AYV48138.1 type II secretion system protein GspE [Caulobacter flavus]PLR06937.1 type II secretion system protein GspE [Caulobacter flavus]